MPTPTHPTKKPGLLKTVAKLARSQIRRYPAHVLDSLKGKPRAHGGEVVRTVAERTSVAASSSGPITLPESPLAAAWLGHASVLLRLGATTILTDPVFAPRVGVRVGKRVVGVARLTPAPVLAPVPPDLILISHAHFDHLDRPTLRALANKQTTIVVPTGTRRLIPKGFGEVISMDWEEERTVRGITIRTIRPKHWGARTLWDRHRRYHSYHLCESGGSSIFFAGDTALTPVFKDIKADLAIFGIGAYDPWVHAHATPEQVWEMFCQMKSSHLMPIHHSTFPLGDEHPDEPLMRLLAVAGRKAGRIVGRGMGEVWARE